MADDGSGNYTLESNLYTGDNIFQQQKAAGLKASSAHIDSLMVDIKNALNARYNIDGSKALTANLNLGGYDLSNWTIASDINLNFFNLNSVGTMTSDFVVTGTGTFSGNVTVDGTTDTEYFDCGDTSTFGGLATFNGGATANAVTATTFCMGGITTPVGTNAYLFLDDVEGGTLLQLQTEHNNLIAALAATGIIQTV